MPDAFLLLSEENKKDVLSMAEAKLNLSAKILEKDVWICWALHELFAVPNHLPMVFKGGTSLSKVFNAIARISEDIDLTIDCTKKFGTPADTRSQRDKQREQIGAFVESYIRERIVPHLQSSADQTFGSNVVRLVQDKDSLQIQYPTVTGSANYLLESVLLEFGGRNKIEPNLTHTVTPYMMKLPELFKIEFPTAKILVLSGQRTFWEKVTLLHDELCRPEIRPNASRLFRHWYDVARIADHEIGIAAINERALLESVVETKSLLYSGSHSKYELCLTKQFKIVPEGSHLTALETDCKAMISSGMFFAESPKFEAVISRIDKLQNELNASSPKQLDSLKKELIQIAAEAQKKKQVDPLSVSQILKGSGDQGSFYNTDQLSGYECVMLTDACIVRLESITTALGLPTGETENMLDELKNAGVLDQNVVDVIRSTFQKLAVPVGGIGPYKDDEDLEATDKIFSAINSFLNLQRS